MPTIDLSSQTSVSLEALDEVIEPIAEPCSDAPDYRPFTWREFGVGRANDDQAHLGVDDTQISDLRI